ncbi:hypothetical protein MFRU_026g00560 [Monilinia fructicola]|nr:hypothetical protein MFRU_026g00560 [Monilinia fructicola]
MGSDETVSRVHMEKKNGYIHIIPSLSFHAVHSTASPAPTMIRIIHSLPCSSHENDLLAHGIIRCYLGQELGLNPGHRAIPSRAPAGYYSSAWQVWPATCGGGSSAPFKATQAPMRMCGNWSTTNYSVLVFIRQRRIKDSKNQTRVERQRHGNQAMAKIAETRSADDSDGRNRRAFHHIPFQS